MMGWLGKNIRHHGLLTAKKNYKLAKILWNNPKKWNFDQKINDAKPLIWSCLSNNFRFSGGFSKPTKTSNKDLSHNDTFSVGLVGLGNYFVCKRFAVHSNPPVATGICDPNKSQARHQRNTVSLKKLHLTNLT